MPGTVAQFAEAMRARRLDAADPQMRRADVRVWVGDVVMTRADAAIRIP